MILYRDGTPDRLLAFDFTYARLTALHAVRNPDKLGRLDAAAALQR